MKKLVLVLCAAMLAAAPALADQATYSKPGSVTAQAGVGLLWGNYDGVEIEGGLDVGLAQLPLVPQVPLDFGVSARIATSTWGGLGLGAFGTMHYSWKALGTRVPVVDALESYLGIGIGILGGLHLAGYGGLAYHLNGPLAIYFENSYSRVGVLGLSYRF